MFQYQGKRSEGEPVAIRCRLGCCCPGSFNTALLNQLNSVWGQPLAVHNWTARHLGNDPCCWSNTTHLLPCLASPLLQSVFYKLSIGKKQKENFQRQLTKNDWHGIEGLRPSSSHNAPDSQARPASLWLLGVPSHLASPAIPWCN